MYKYVYHASLFDFWASELKSDDWRKPACTFGGWMVVDSSTHTFICTCFDDELAYFLWHTWFQRHKFVWQEQIFFANVIAAAAAVVVVVTIAIAIICGLRFHIFLSACCLQISISHPFRFISSLTVASVLLWHSVLPDAAREFGSCFGIENTCFSFPDPHRVSSQPPPALLGRANVMPLLNKVCMRVCIFVLYNIHVYTYTPES